MLNYSLFSNSFLNHKHDKSKSENREYRKRHGNVVELVSESSQGLAISRIQHNRTWWEKGWK